MAFSGSLNFIDKSDAASFWYTGPGGPYRVYGYDKSYEGDSLLSQSVYTDFVGLNYNFYDPITDDQNFLGYSDLTLTDIGGSTIKAVNYLTDFIYGVVGTAGGGKVLNGLLLHRNGPYQHPMWKQYRGGDHPIARYFRLHNTMSIDLADPDPIRRMRRRKLFDSLKENKPPGASGYDHIPVSTIGNAQDLKRFYEPSVVSKYKPFIYSADVGSRPGKVRVTLGNQLAYFSNIGLNNAVKIAAFDRLTGSNDGFSRNNQEYYQIFHAAKEHGATNFLYSETMFPKSINAYRPYKLSKANYEEVPGLGPNGYDRNPNGSRFFWKDDQGPSITSSAAFDAPSNGTTRTRTDEQALNSFDHVQVVDWDRTDQDGYSSRSPEVITGAANPNWTHSVIQIHPGIVSHQISTVTGTLDSYFNPTAEPRSAFVQLEAYQPYKIALLSSWPLDPVIDIYNKPAMLTSSVGGRGPQIGLTPHKARDSRSSAYYDDPYTSSTIGNKVLGILSLHTGTAGELVYSTKPTITYFVTSSTDPWGYKSPTASLQYNRHTYPYNTPFWATHKIRGRNPMHNSYSDFAQDFKYIGRDYSIIPEYRSSDHFNYYHETYYEPKGYDTKLYHPNRLPDTPYAPARWKIIRTLKIGASIASTPLNFLKINGATPNTASAVVQSLSEFVAISPGPRYAYDPVDQSAFVFDTTPGEPSAPPTYVESPHTVQFFERFSHTDDIINFAHLMDQNNEGFAADVNTVPTKIKFTVRGIKKLLPYNGFYPVTRTVQIGNNLKQAEAAYGSKLMAFTSNKVTAQDPIGAVRQQILLEPLMSPGVLYNSIKSGIAVDYPIYTELPAYHSPLAYSTLTTGYSINDATVTHTGFFPSISSSFNYGGFYMMGAARTVPAVLKSLPNHRVGFEAVYNLSKLDFLAGNGTRMYLTHDVTDMDRTHPLSAVSALALYNKVNINVYTGDLSRYQPKPFSDEKSHTGVARYERSMNNFLSETMDFFLGDARDDIPGVKLPIILSEIKSKNAITPKENTTYYMDVGLRMGEQQVMCEGPRFSGMGRRAPGGHEGGIWPDHPVKMRGYIYGPPIEIVPESAEVSSHFVEGVDDLSAFDAAPAHPRVNVYEQEGYWAANLQDPAYQAYTPPYFYGKSSMVLSFTQDAVPDLGDPYVSMPHIWNKAEQESFYFEQYNTGSFIGDFEGLSVTIPSSGSVSSGSLSRMKIDRSVDIFNPPVPLSFAGNTDPEMTEYIWYIAPKWVCPVLDFSSSVSIFEERQLVGKKQIKTLSYTNATNIYHDTTTGKGMWGGYGTDPYDGKVMGKLYSTTSTPVNKRDKGIWLETRDIFTDKTDNIQEQSTGFLTDFNSNVGLYTNRNVSGDSNNTGSLADLLGFEKTRVPIGKFASSRRVSEAIVIIPYFERRAASMGWLRDNVPVDDPHWQAGIIPGNSEVFSTREIIPGKHFLPIHKTLFENILSIHLAESFYEESYSSPLDPATAAGPAGVVSNLIGMNSEESILAAKNTDVGRMISTLLGDSANLHPGARKGYQLPPEFDFIHHADVDPFQMIVIPMEHFLSKQDLIDIYQGVMPDISVDLEKIIRNEIVRPSAPSPQYDWVPFVYGDPVDKPDISMASLDLANFLSPKAALAYRSDPWAQYIVGGLDQGFIGANPGAWIKSSRDFYKNLKFMVFKVKEAANKDFARYRKKQIAQAIKSKASSRPGGIEALPSEFSDTIRKWRLGDVHGMNWPYDYFSLIETVKIDVEIEVSE